jgi:cytoplasmic iron level regulating protein YaaA (DUF328/UPF0246 family)
MLILLSPSKTQDIETLAPTDIFSEPLFEEERWKLIKELKKLEDGEVKDMMKLSSNLLDTHRERISGWNKRHTQKNAKQAIHVFTGHVYKEFEETTFTKRHYAYMQKHIAILSGMYGVLRPLDLIQPYRLEMATKLSGVYKKEPFKNLYEFWTDLVTNYICNAKHKIVLDCASREYTKTIDREGCPLQWIDVVFLEKEGKGFRQVTVYSKKARGTLAAWCVKNNCKGLEDVKVFREDGYKYSKKHSDDYTLTFVR